MTVRKKKTAEDAAVKTGVDLGTGPDKTVIVWKATRPLTVKEHESLSAKLRHEAQATGANILLVPYVVEADNAPNE